jgi:hypothetical protein
LLPQARLLCHTLLLLLLEQLVLQPNLLLRLLLQLL